MPDKVIHTEIKPTLTKKGCAALAAMDAGIYERASFEKFWSLYLENLVDKQQHDIDYFIEMLNKQGEERARDRTNNHREKLKLMFFYSVSFLFGSVVTLLFRL